MKSDLLLLCREMTCGHEFGFRDVHLQCIAVDGNSKFDIELMLSPGDAITLARYVIAVNREAWRCGRRPYDAAPQEAEPNWLVPGLPEGARS